MTRLFLDAYIFIGIVVAVLSVIISIVTGESVNFLSEEGWLTLIAACGFASISESIDKKK